MQKIDWNEMFKYTGDPFVDAGGFVLQELMECYPDADIMTLIMMVTNTSTMDTLACVEQSRN